VDGSPVLLGGGRCSHDYYEHSVTPRLAPQRVDPTFVSVIGIERDLGIPLISLIALTGQRSLLRRLRRPLYVAAPQPAPVTRAFPADVNLRLLEIGLQAI
jgi:hypothetical protein